MSNWSTRLLEPETLRPRAPAELLAALRQLRAEICADGSKMLDRWRRGTARQAFKLSAANLAHYLALRRRDLRDLQDELTLLGLSSLGRLEARVLANLDAVIAALAPHASDQARSPARVPSIAVSACSSVTALSCLAIASGSAERSW